MRNLQVKTVNINFLSMPAAREHRHPHNQREKQFAVYIIHTSLALNSFHVMNHHHLLLQK
jgi:hypothetical protein